MPVVPGEIKSVKMTPLDEQGKPASDTIDLSGITASFTTYADTMQHTGSELVAAFTTAAEAFRSRWRMISFEMVDRQMAYFVAMASGWDHWLDLAERRGITEADVRCFVPTLGGLWVRCWNGRRVLILANPSYSDLHEWNPT